jgi:hypothetical protein
MTSFFRPTIACKDGFLIYAFSAVSARVGEAGGNGYIASNALSQKELPCES